MDRRTRNKAMKKIPFKEGLFHMADSPGEAPYLIGSRCTECGYVAFPRRETCLSCLKNSVMEEVPLSRRGTLDSYAIVQQGAPGFEAPYIQAWVRLPEGPKVFTLVVGCKPEEGALQMGQEMEMVIGKIREDEDGNEIVAWKFKPIVKS